MILSVRIPQYFISRTTSISTLGRNGTNHTKVVLEFGKPVFFLCKTAGWRDTVFAQRGSWVASIPRRRSWGFDSSRVPANCGGLSALTFVANEVVEVGAGKF